MAFAHAPLEAAALGPVAGKFVGADAALRATFSEVLDRAETLCGPLDAQHSAELFAGGVSAGSAVVMPLHGGAWDGVVVIASDDPARYQADMGTEILTYLRDVVTLVIEPWVKRARNG